MTTDSTPWTAAELALDNSLFTAAGLEGLSARDKSEILELFSEELQVRVGRVLSDRLDREELLEVEGAIDAGDDSETLAWLESHLPDYKLEVRAQYQTLLDELCILAPRIKQATMTEKDQVGS